MEHPAVRMANVNDIEIELTVQIGEAVLPLKRLLSIGRGGVISLGGDDEQPVKILANGRPIRTGQVILRGEQIAVAVD